MKASERHRLKENELVQSLNAARDFVASRRKQLGGLLLVIVLIAVGVLGFTIVRRQTSARGEQLLADAMVALNAPVVPATAPSAEPGQAPAAAMLDATGSFGTEEAKLKAALPKLKAAADAYPDAQSGIVARYHMAGALASLGQSAEAIQAFDEVVKRAGDDSLYGRMARLGKAEAEVRAGQLDAAIASYKELASSTDADDPLPKDAILLELAKAYAAKGDQEEARKTYTQLIDEHPTSAYSVEAKTELDSMKS